MTYHWFSFCFELALNVTFRQKSKTHVLQSSAYIYHFHLFLFATSMLFVQLSSCKATVFLFMEISVKQGHTMLKFCNFFIHGKIRVFFICNMCFLSFLYLLQIKSLIIYLQNIERLNFFSRKINIIKLAYFFVQYLTTLIDDFLVIQFLSFFYYLKCKMIIFSQPNQYYMKK